MNPTLELTITEKIRFRCVKGIIPSPYVGLIEETNEDLRAKLWLQGTSMQPFSSIKNSIRDTIDPPIPPTVS